MCILKYNWCNFAMWSPWGSFEQISEAYKYAALPMHGWQIPGVGMVCFCPPNDGTRVGWVKMDVEEAESTAYIHTFTWTWSSWAGVHIIQTRISLKTKKRASLVTLKKMKAGFLLHIFSTDYKPLRLIFQRQKGCRVCRPFVLSNTYFFKDNC